jgi:hypothetical protein
VAFPVVAKGVGWQDDSWARAAACFLFVVMLAVLGGYFFRITASFRKGGREKANAQARGPR